jgi:hypothetical protein
MRRFLDAVRMISTKPSASNAEPLILSGHSSSILSPRCVSKILTRGFSLALRDPKNILQ